MGNVVSGSEITRLVVSVARLVLMNDQLSGGVSYDSLLSYLKRSQLNSACSFVLNSFLSPTGNSGPEST